MADLGGQRVVVTGAAGFIGSHVAARLVAEGASVHTFVHRPRAQGPSPIGADLVETVVDVTDASAVEAAIAAAAPAVVVHLVADTRIRHAERDHEAVDRSIDVNLRGTLNVAMASIRAGSVRTFIRTGGLEEYGFNPVPFVETQREDPISLYSASQVAATHYLAALQRTTLTALITLRPALVYGPGQSSDFLIPSLIQHCLRGADFAMTDGAQRRDLLFVDDLVEAVVLAAGASRLPAGTILNLGHGVEHRMSDVAAMIVRMIGDGRLLIGERRPRYPDMQHLVATTARASHLLGWRPRVSLQDGLRQTVDAYRAAMVEG